MRTIPSSISPRYCTEQSTKSLPSKMSSAHLAGALWLGCGQWCSRSPTLPLKMVPPITSHKHPYHHKNICAFLCSWWWFSYASPIWMFISRYNQGTYFTNFIVSGWAGSHMPAFGSRASAYCTLSPIAGCNLSPVLKVPCWPRGKLTTWPWANHFPSLNQFRHPHKVKFSSHPAYSHTLSLPPQRL